MKTVIKEVAVSGFSCNLNMKLLLLLLASMLAWLLATSSG